jgi:TolA-binding protein
MKDIPIDFSIDCATLSKQTIRIPYLHRLGDDLELTRAPKTIKGFDFSSKAELDDFLNKYPESDRASLIFAIRMKLLRDGAKDAKTEEELLNAINEYNDFIAKYPDTTGAQIATHEVFRVYERHDSIAAYTEFIKRYPFSLEVNLAEEHIKRKLFDATMAQNDIEAYDHFVETFPEAEPYVTQIINRAAEIEQSKVQSLLESLKDKPKSDQRIEKDDYASDLYKKWHDLALKSTSPRGAKIHQVKINRIEYLLTTELSTTPSFQILTVRKLVEDVKKQLTQLDVLIQRNHEETITTINQGFQRLHEHLDQRFNALNGTLNKIEERLKRQEDSTAALDQRLKDLSVLIDAHYAELRRQSGDIKRQNDELKEALRSANKHGTLDTALTVVSTGLDLYNAWRSPYEPKGEASKTFNLHFNPDIVIKHNSNPKSLYSKLGNLFSELCPTLSGALVATTSVTGPLAMGAGIFANQTCKWGVGWLSKKFGG